MSPYAGISGGEAIRLERVVTATLPVAREFHLRYRVHRFLYTAVSISRYPNVQDHSISQLHNGLAAES